MAPEGPAIMVRGADAPVRRDGRRAATVFQIPRGEIFALLGPDGAGKTTTLQTALRSDPADERMS